MSRFFLSVLVSYHFDKKKIKEKDIEEDLKEFNYGGQYFVLYFFGSIYQQLIIKNLKY